MNSWEDIVMMHICSDVLSGMFNIRYFNYLKKYQNLFKENYNKYQICSSKNRANIKVCIKRIEIIAHKDNAYIQVVRYLISERQYTFNFIRFHHFYTVYMML